jgi:hypothetical protein
MIEKIIEEISSFHEEVTFCLKKLVRKRKLRIFN